MRLRNDVLDVAALADSAFLLREVARMHDDLRKECERLRDTVESKACLIWINVGDDSPIHGEMATASPDMKITPTLPSFKSDPEAYRTLLEFMGVSEEAIDRGTFKVYWPAFCDYVTDLTKQGKPMPPGIDPKKMFVKYKLNFKARKEPHDE